MDSLKLVGIGGISLFCPIYLLSADVNALEIRAYRAFHGDFLTYKSVENTNGSANAIFNRGTLQIDNSSLQFGDVEANQNASGINLSYFNKIAFSGGSIEIGNITSTQDNAYGIKSMGKGIFRLYHSLFAFVDSSIDIGSITGAKDAYGMQSTQELDIQGSGRLNRGVITFRGIIEGANQAYGVKSLILTLSGTNLNFRSTIKSRQNAYGIYSEKEILIQESDTKFASIVSENTNAYGIWAKGNFSLQNSETSSDVSLLSFASISAKESAYGIYQDEPSQANPAYVIRNARLRFDSINSSKSSYGLYNQGIKYEITNNFFNSSGGFVEFGTIESQGESVGIFNAKGSQNRIDLVYGELSFADIEGKTEAYGIKSLTPFSLSFKNDGNPSKNNIAPSVRFGNIVSNNNAYGIYAQDAETKLDFLKQGSVSFSSIQGKNAYGIYANNSNVQINLNHSTLSFSLKGENQQVFASERNGKINITLSNDSRLIVDGNGGTIHSLSVGAGEHLALEKKSSLIDLSGFSSGSLQTRNQARSLSIEEYKNIEAQLVVGLFVDPSKGYSDKITIKKTKESNLTKGVNLQVYFDPKAIQATSKGAQKLVLAEVDSKVRVNGIAHEGGEGVSRVDIGFERVLTTIHSAKSSGSGMNEYFINTNEKPTFLLNPNLSFESFMELSNQYNLHFFNLGQISKRLGTLRKGYDEGGIWGRMSAGRSGFSGGSALSAFSIELGGDYEIFQGKHLSAYLGGNFSYTTSFLSSKKDDAQGMEIGLYAGIMSQKWYYYAQVKGEYLNNQIFNPSINPFEINQGIITLSQELGYRLGSERGGFYFEPKTQFDLSFTLPTSYTQVDSVHSTTLQTKLDLSMFLGGKVGGDIGYSFVNSNALKIDLYIGIFYDYLLFDKQNIHFQTQNHNQTSSLNKRFYQGVSFAIGSHIEASEHIKLAMDIDFGFGNGFYNVAKGSFGLKYVF